jgi:hypothetical protein
MTTFSLQAQIAEVEREIEMRVSVYTRQIAAGKLRKSEAEYRTDCMRAVLESLRGLAREPCNDAEFGMKP